MFIPSISEILLFAILVIIAVVLIHGFRSFKKDADEDEDLVPVYSEDTLLDDIEIPVRYGNLHDQILPELDYPAYDDGLSLEELKMLHFQQDYQTRYLHGRSDDKSLAKANHLLVSGDIYERLHRVYRYYFSCCEADFRDWCENILCDHIDRNATLFEGILKNNQ